MVERWSDGRWYRSWTSGEFIHRRAGYYEEGVEPPLEALDIRISENSDIVGLIALLEQEGFIKPRLDERLRTEDLKITHRLLDVVDTLTKKEYV